MPAIASIVFFDIETTGLPLQEKNQTKIIEFSLVAVLRKDVEATPYGQIPPVLSKISSVLNPEKPIGRVVTQMTGLSRKKLAKAPTFREKLGTITSFLTALPSPVCLVAHNGNSFDFRILLAECNDISASLPANLYCVDSLPGLRSILMGTGIDYSSLGGKMNQEPVKLSNSIATVKRNEVPADSGNIEDEDLIFEDLVLSAEETEVIGEVVIDGTHDDSEVENQAPVQAIIDSKKRGAESAENANKKKCLNEKGGAESANTTDRECFKLTSVYKRLLNKEGTNAHRAENDCLMLLECVVALKEQFLPWADKNCQLLTKIRPLSRNWWRRRPRFYR